jgi:leader peptidase (prepilin peptidase)/N-methyltransferase
LLTLLITATATDLREYIIPDWITYPGTLFGVILATASGDVQIIHFWVDWNHPLAAVMGPEIPEWIKQHPHLHGLAWSLAGAVAGAGITWLSRLISSLVLGQEAMGFGDVTLMGMIGSYLGWQPMVFVFLLAPFCGICVGIVVKTMVNRSYVPYGPYLSVAALIVMFFWKWIWQWEPTPRVSIRKLFGDIPSLAILATVTFVLLSVLLGIARWWRGSALIAVEFPNQTSANDEQSIP